MKSSRGFTLIEVLIAMTLLSMIMVVLFTSLKTCVDAWQKGEAKMNQVNQAAIVYHFFQKHLATARPMWDDMYEEGERHFSFEGKEQAIVFVSKFPASARRGGLQKFTVSLYQDGENAAIKVSMEPFFHPANDHGWRTEEVTLVDHVVSFSLFYFGSEDGVNDSEWMTDWLDKDHQPQEIKIMITVLDQETKQVVSWPEMLIPLKMMVDSSAAQGIQSDEVVVDGSSQ